VRLRIALDSLVDLARSTKKNGVPVTQDPVMRQKLAQMWIDTEVFKYTGARAITKLLKGEMRPRASAGKMMWVEGHQRVQGAGHGDQGPFGQLTHGSEWAVADGLWQHTFCARGPTPSKAAPPRSAQYHRRACSASRRVSHELRLQRRQGCCGTRREVLRERVPSRWCGA
jgi:hypothetical protein